MDSRLPLQAGSWTTAYVVRASLSLSLCSMWEVTFSSPQQISSPQGLGTSHKCPGGAWLPGIPREHWPGGLIAPKNPGSGRGDSCQLLLRGQLWHGWQWFHIGSLETNKNGCWTVAGAEAFGSQGPVTAVVDGCLVMTAGKACWVIAAVQWQLGKDCWVRDTRHSGWAMAAQVMDAGLWLGTGSATDPCQQ